MDFKFHSILPRHHYRFFFSITINFVDDFAWRVLLLWLEKLYDIYCCRGEIQTNLNKNWNNKKDHGMQKIQCKIWRLFKECPIKYFTFFKAVVQKYN